MRCARSQPRCVRNSSQMRDRGALSLTPVFMMLCACCVAVLVLYCVLYCVCELAYKISNAKRTLSQQTNARTHRERERDKAMCNCVCIHYATADSSSTTRKAHERVCASFHRKRICFHFMVRCCCHIIYARTMCAHIVLWCGIRASVEMCMVCVCSYAQLRKEHGGCPDLLA